MAKRYLILIITLFAIISVAFGQRDDCPMLKYNNSQLQLESGNGELYYLGGGHDAHKQRYYKTYYLFTDSSFVNISSQYRESNYGYYKNHNKLAIKSIDKTSHWIFNGERLHSRVVSSSNIRNGGYGFSWENRAFILFDTWDDKKTDSNCTVALIVLPVPSHDTLITGYDLTDKHIENGNLTANLKIGRTGRIVFDSIWIDSIPQDSVKYNGDYSRDTPYYRSDPHAMITIDMPVSDDQKRINVTMFYRWLSPDGTIIPLSEELSVPIRIDFPIVPVAIAVVLGVLLFAIIMKVDKALKKNKPNREAKRAEKNRLKGQIEKQKNRIAELEEHLRTAKATIGKKEQKICDLESKVNVSNSEVKKMSKELSDAKNKQYTSEDSKELCRRCDEVIKEIDALYGEIKHNGVGMSADVVAEKVRQLEKIIIIKRNS